MASDKKIIDEVGESSHDTPQAITITIMDPSALEATDLDSSLVTSVETQDDRHGTSTLLVVPGDGHASISVEHGAKNILQTVTETHMGTHELPVISNISNPEEETSEQNSIHVTKTSQIIDEGEGVDEEDGEEPDESVGQHCLICNVDLPSEESTEPVLVFKTQTTTTQRKMSVFLGSLIGQKLTSRKAHSDIMCHRCFGLLDRVDSLEVEIRDTKEEIVNKYQETVAVYGGRARRRKPATAKKTDYVFPKVEPEDEDEQVLGLEMDENFEPRVEDLMEEENDHREDRSTQDEEWEPEFKKPRIKREAVDAESSGPTKRKRGRPRKDAAKPKAEAVNLRKGGGADSGDDAFPACNRPACPVCSTTFSFHSQLRRHIRYEHPNFGASELECSTCALSSNRKLEEIHMELEEDGSSNDVPLVFNLSCSWCELKFDDKEAYDEHLDEHSMHAYQQYLVTLEESETDVENDDSLTVFKSNVDESIKSIDLVNVKHVTLKNSDENSNTSESKGKHVTIRSGKRNITKDTPGYKCEFCGLMNSSKVNLEYHLDKCHESVARRCGLCYELCLDAASLRSHLVHHYNGVLVCPVCPIRFSIRYNLTAHLEHCHQNGYVVSCGECKAEFTHYDSYEAHRAHDHGRGALRTCEICNKEVLAVDIDKHMKTHEDSEIKSEVLPHTCNLCNAHFSLTNQLYHHKYQDHPDAFNFKCDECERRFRTERTLTAHKWGHRYGAHQCPACRLKYRQVDQLKRHLLSVHPEFEGYNCKFCSTTLKNYSTYVAHLKFKHPKEAGYDKRPVRCKLCGELFAHKVQWKYHMRNHTHSLQTCEICGITVKNLEIHMNLHTKEKKFECGDCGAVYHNKASFHFHVKRVHMGEEVRKHICAICKKGFLTPADLRIHMSRVHRGERNYWCTTCNKGYKSQVSLTYHERLHTGERPHQCTMCRRSFRVPSYLKRHVEHDHRAQYTGVYYKQGRPKSQEQRSRAQRHHPHRPNRTVPLVSTLEETVEPIPEIVQITVPMEMGGEVISAVGSAQELGRDQRLELEQGGVVYVVYEN